MSSLTVVFNLQFELETEVITKERKIKNNSEEYYS